MQLHRRRKTLLACRKCRERRTRCNGGRPSCQSCIDRGLQAQCEYEKGLGKAHVLSSSTEQWPRNAEQVETSFSSAQESQRLTGRDSLTSQSSLLEPRGVVHSHLPGNALKSHTDHNYNHSDDKLFQANSSIEGFIDDIDRRAPLAGVTEQPSQSETRRLRYGVAGTVSENLSHGSFVDCEPVLAILPERSLADALIELYCRHLHPIFPILHLPTLRSSYQQLWIPNHVQPSGTSNDMQERAIFHSTLNIIFAIGCQYYDKFIADQRARSADQFYQRARSFVSIDSLDNSSLATVQMLLLTGIYLHTARYAHRCWNIIGMALRVAQGLDLHVENISRCNESQLAREMRRRVWYNCVILDKLTATTFGRPAFLVRKTMVELPRPIDDEYLRSTTEECQQPMGVPAQIEGFIQTIKLFDILNDVLSNLYSQDDSVALPGSSRFEDSTSNMTKIFTLNSRLDEFLDNLPFFLRLGSQQSNSDLRGSTDSEAGRKCTFQLQAHVLYCRCLYIRILILRPSLLSKPHPEKYRDGQSHIPESRGLERSAMNEMKSLCISSAQQVIEVLFAQQQSEENSSGWHAIYFAFTAATVIWAAAISSPSSVDLEVEPYKTLWDKAIEILKYNQVQLQASSHAIEVLESCRRKLDVAKKQRILNATTVVHDKPVTPFVQNEVAQQLDEMQREHETDWSLPLQSDLLDFSDPDLFAESWAFTQASSTDNWS